MWVSGEARGSQEDLVLHPGARALLTLWQELKGEQPAPARTDLDLRQVPRQAPWMFILEPGEADGFTFRLAGTGICSFLRKEVTGTNALAGWSRFERTAIARALDGTTARLQPVHLRLRYMTDRGQRIGADLLALPITARGGRGVHVLGGLFPHANPEIWQYESLAPVELAAVRLLDGRPSPVRAAGQAPRKFQVISGGLDLT